MKEKEIEKRAAYEVAVSVPCGVCAEISQGGDIWINQKDIREILRRLYDQKGVEIIEEQACSDHTHIRISIPRNIVYYKAWDTSKGKVA